MRYNENPRNYYYSQFCKAINAAPVDVIRTVEKIIHGAVNGEVSTHRNWFTVKEIAVMVGLKPQAVSRCLTHMEAKGLMIRERHEGKFVWSPMVPERVGNYPLWERSSHLRIHPKAGLLKQGVSTAEGEGVKQGVTKNETPCFTEEGDDDLSIRSKDLGAAAGAAAVTSAPEESEVEERVVGEPDEVEVRETKERAKAATITPLGVRDERGKREHSGPEHKEHPRSRWELKRPTGDPASWKKMQFVAHWAHAHFDALGEESPELKVRNGNDLTRHAKNLHDYGETWLGSNWKVALRDAMDAVIRDAKRLGYPVSLAYFFAPTRKGPLPELLAGKRRGGTKGQTINEVNDKLCVDSDTHRKLIGEVYGDDDE